MSESVKMTPPPFGVLLVNLGTPSAPTPEAVRTYLAEFLADVRVVDMARPLWWLILHGIILRVRPRKVAKAYQSIWTPEGSPLLAISRQQTAALTEALQQAYGQKIPVELAMTYGEPSMEAAGRALRQQGVSNLLILPLYPQFSSSTTGAVYDRLARGLQKCPHLPQMRWVRDYHQHPAYIEALAASVRQHWQEHGRKQKLLMSFHGIPERYADKGDPYAAQCRKTAELLAQALQLSTDEYLCSFQSRFGREEWVKPYTDASLKQWARDGVHSVDVICPAFAADCLETLEEIQVENRELFLKHGGQAYAYIPALNARPEHMDLLTELVQTHTQGW
ncbi:ferrochelatase [Allopseudospirillum japonicum]|uniref:Ferrochelatase n=1 Tax=Allopseudospirillum japonicum TaxID=64971 RepID=A0A1H6QD44_9GAMM|nr:ferrochelatase [Allopseudospirillum japonicum]SEI39796.1 ferrochelatase [Allopseudospirillum japonicum]